MSSYEDISGGKVRVTKEMEMKEEYKGETADWYEDSEEYEKVMMLGNRCLGKLGYSLEYHQLPQDLKDTVKLLFSYDITSY